jgi:LacI family transcriptional regulator
VLHDDFTYPESDGIVASVYVNGTNGEKKPKATVKEIALLAGVSIGTVDRVLHERGEVSVKTRERVERILLETGFRPNLHARQLSLAKEFVFKALLPEGSQDSGYWALCASGITTAAEELSPFHVKVETITYDRYDEGSAALALDRAAEDPGDGILIAPISSGPVSSFLAALPPGLPYVFFDARKEGASPLCEIGQDAARSGFFAGRLVALLCGGTGEVCAINAHARDLHISQRIEGFRGYFAANGTGPVHVEECFELEVPEACEAFLDEVLSRHPRTRGIFVSNASGYTVASYLEDRGLRPAVTLVCYDLVPGNIEGLRRGGIDCVLSQRPEQQTYRGIMALHRAVVLGEACEKRILMPLDVHFKENLEPEASLPPI